MEAQTRGIAEGRGKANENVTVINVPVNYAIRFSDHVTALTASHVWYGV
jgi:hypothetical protein